MENRIEMFGISDKLLESFKRIKEKYEVKMCIFGSRARGDYKYNSDIDIAIINSNIATDIKYKIMNEFDEIDCQYKIDLIFIQDIENNDFLDSIKNEGEMI